MRDARQRAFEALILSLGETPIGRELGLARLRNFRDLRASVPVRSPDEHLEEVGSRLGFGEKENLAGPFPHPLAQGFEARLFAELGELGGLNPGLWWSTGRASRARLAALEAVSAFKGRVRTFAGPPDASLLSELEEAEVGLLWAPSAAHFAELEFLVRSELSQRLPKLRLLLAEYEPRQVLSTSLAVLHPGLWAGEVRLAAPQSTTGHRSLVLDSGQVLLELMPLRSRAARNPPAPSLPEEAVAGERYELVVTHRSGQLRRRSGLFVRVTGFVDAGIGVPVPLVQPQAEPPALVALEGLRLDGATICAALRQAFLREDPALVAAQVGDDPEAVDSDTRETALRLGMDPFADTEFGASVGARSRGSGAGRVARSRGLVARIQVQGIAPRDFAKGLSRRFDEVLARIDPAYAYLRQQEDLFAPRVLIAEPGTATRERELRMRALDGPVELPRIVVRSRL